MPPSSSSFGLASGFGAAAESSGLFGGLTFAASALLASIIKLLLHKYTPGESSLGTEGLVKRLAGMLHKRGVAKQKSASNINRAFL